MLPRCSLLLGLLLAFFVPRITSTPVPTPHNNSSHALDRRQCTWSETIDDWSCDDYLPSLSQFVTRMQDSKNDGRATPENSAMFYANLFEPPANKEKLWVMWNNILGWMKSQGLDNNYGALYSLDKDWEHAQVAYIESHELALLVRYGGPEWKARSYYGQFPSPLRAALEEVRKLTINRDVLQPSSRICRST